MQLTSTPGNPNNPTYSAAAWIAPQRDPANPSSWVDGSAPATSVPWCPGEPNYHNSDEGCASLMTGCGAPGAAVNDYNCAWPLRVICQVEDSLTCEWRRDQHLGFYCLALAAAGLVFALLRAAPSGAF
jgi:hypothetical protein